MTANHDRRRLTKGLPAKELIRLIDETGRIETMPYELMLKTLDQIEIGLDGKPDVVFLTGNSI